MSGPRWRRSDRGESEAGTTLIELLVVMVVFSVILGIIVSAITVMQSQQRRQSAVGDNLDSARKIIQTLDRQLRYASAITKPVTGSDGNLYVAWRLLNRAQQQTCTQWRQVVATNQLQSRTWLPLAGGSYSTLTAWTTIATNIGTDGVNSFFTLVKPAAPSPPASAVPTAHEALLIAFASKSIGTPSVTTNSQVTITALNSPNSDPPTGLCTEVGTP